MFLLTEILFDWLISGVWSKKFYSLVTNSSFREQPMQREKKQLQLRRQLIELAKLINDKIINTLIY